jgi:hypothetical protein
MTEHCIKDEWLDTVAIKTIEHCSNKKMVKHCSNEEWVSTIIIKKWMSTIPIKKWLSTVAKMTGFNVRKMLIGSQNG